MQQNDAQIGKIMLPELKSCQYKQQMTFSDSEINSNAASLFSNVFFIEFFSFIQQQTTYSRRERDHNGAEEKQKEEGKKKSKKPKNARH